ncbi:hypothetical protein BV898_10214 [Hypsibius exemplaris]|uniref:Uncharacterized protein n=1 Tax=Hypsibius exemplaris TaxID=2072580 RepID=A0A1W0WKC7_HYPEX|nr:hypothetical protein BV898_10214 [Hypsibius exemplaris]
MKNGGKFRSAPRHVPERKVSAPQRAACRNGKFPLRTALRAGTESFRSAPRRVPERKVSAWFRVELKI